jgi:hypothetical protein
MSGSDGSRDQLGRALRLSFNHRIHSAAALVLRHGLSVRAATHPYARIPALRLCVRRSRLARLVQNLGAAGTWVRASRGQQAVVGCARFRNAQAAFDVPTMSTGTVPKVSWRNPPNPCNASTAARNAFACSSLIGIRLPRFVDAAENSLKINVPHLDRLPPPPGCAAYRTKVPDSQPNSATRLNSGSYGEKDANPADWLG